VEQVRQAANAWIMGQWMGPAARELYYQWAVSTIKYHQNHNHFLTWLILAAFFTGIIIVCPPCPKTIINPDKRMIDWDIF